MDIWALIIGLGVITGIVAGIVQVLDYLQKQREKKREPTAREVTIPSPPAPAVPSNLPPRSEFIGREKEKVRAREALASRWPLTCIDGIGGIGKTALAREVAHESLRASKGEMPADDIPTFDGFIWTTAKDRELALNDVLDAIARTLDYPGIAQQPLEEKQESVCRLLQTRPYLLIVDNFETVTDDAVRDFVLRLPEPSKALITSREQKLRQVWAISLKGLEQEEALTLIRSEGRRLGLASVEKAEERVLLRLYQATGGAPLAIKWAMGQIKQKGQSLDTVLTTLHEARGDIFEEVFARSWSLLTDEARRVLMVMPIFAASASRAAIEAASDMHHFALDEGLGQLVEMWLVEVTDELDEARRRYSIHPLTRAFAGRKLGEDARFEKNVRLQTVRYYLDFGKQHGGKRNWQGHNLLEAERENIIATMSWAYDAKDWRAVLNFRNTITDFLGIRGYWTERIRCAEQAIDACKHLREQQSLAWCMVYDLAWTYFRRGDESKAKQHVSDGQAIFEKIGDKKGIALSLRHLAKIARRQGDIEESHKLFRKSLAVSVKADDESLTANIKVDLANLANWFLGDYQMAKRECEQAQEIFERLSDQNGLAQALSGLGHVAITGQDYDGAKSLFEQALAISQAIGRRDQIAFIKWGLATLEEQTGNLFASLSLAREAYEVYWRLGVMPEGEMTRVLVERLEGKLSAD